MTQEINKEEFDKLVEILFVLHQVESRSMETDAMFEPLKDIVELLKTYNEEVENRVHTQVNKIVKVKVFRAVSILIRHYVIVAGRSSYKME